MPNNIGAFGENFPYTNQHDLNMNWMIQTMKEFKDNYTNLNQTIENGVQSVEQTGETAVANIQTAELSALNRIDYAVENTQRRYILIGDSYGTRTTSSGLTYYDIVKDGLGIDDRNIFFKAVPGAAFGHQSGASFLEVLESMTITDPDTITDIFIQCGANDIGYTVAQEQTGLNAFINYVKQHYPKAKCSIFACGLTLDHDNMFKRMTETLVTFRAFSQRGYRFILNSDTVLMNTVLLESDKCHPNTYGVNYLAWQLAMAMQTGHCDNAYRLYQEQLNTTVEIENLAGGATVGYSVTDIELRCANNITEIHPEERITIGLNLNDVTLTPSNYINVIMDNCLGIPPEGQKVPVTLAVATDGTNIPGYMTYEKLENGKYRLRIRPLYNLALGSSNSYFHIFFNFTFINS